MVPKTAVVTGAAGFLGRAIAQRLALEGYAVVGVDARPAFVGDPGTSEPSSILRSVQMDLPSPALDALLSELRPSLCVHCAGRASVPLSVSDPATDFRLSPHLTFGVLDALRLHAPECSFVFLSSAAVYGDPEALPVSESAATAPVSPYGFHKLLCEQLCLEFVRVYGLRAASLRIFSAYGAELRRQVLWDIACKALRGPALALAGTGAESRDFVHARDVAEAVCVVARAARFEGEVYNLATGRETTVREAALLLLHALGIERPVTFDGVLPKGTPRRWRADIGRLRALGFEPSVALEQGLSEAAARWRCELSTP